MQNEKYVVIECSAGAAMSCRGTFGFKGACRLAASLAASNLGVDESAAEAQLRQHLTIDAEMSAEANDYSVAIVTLSTLEEATDEIVTTSVFWDCECEKGYIRHKEEENCPHCKANREEQPDSRLNEVVEWLSSTAERR